MFISYSVSKLTVRDPVEKLNEATHIVGRDDFPPCCDFSIWVVLSACRIWVSQGYRSAGPTFALSCIVLCSNRFILQILSTSSQKCQRDGGTKDGCSRAPRSWIFIFVAVAVMSLVHKIAHRFCDRKIVLVVVHAALAEALWVLCEPCCWYHSRSRRRNSESDSVA